MEDSPTITCDYHNHTNRSDGKCTLSELARTAAERGLKTIAVTDHSTCKAHGLSIADFELQRSELTALNETGGIKLLFGVEANLLGNGKLDLPPSMTFEVIIAGYHRAIMPRNKFAFNALKEALVGFGNLEKNTDEYMRIMDNYDINIIAHPNEYIRVNMKRLAKKAAERGIAIEINNRHVTVTADELKIAADMGAHFVISSDSHKPAQIGSYENAIAVARSAGVLGLVNNYSDD